MADENLILSKTEAELVRRIATSRGITEAEAAEMIVKKEVERRVRLRTGKGPAKIYGLRKRG